MGSQEGLNPLPELLRLGLSPNGGESGILRHDAVSAGFAPE